MSPELEDAFILIDNDTSNLNHCKRSSSDHDSTHSNPHDCSERGTGFSMKIDGRHLVDSYGRVCSLRGVNMSGSSKTPANHDHENFPGDHASVTFVGRPFPLEQAHEHFSRLRRWGLTFIRFLVTWEAVEHAGPGLYDMDYLDYIRQLLSLLPTYGLTAFVSMHQDVWSRYSGGSGAPAWTIQVVGFDLKALEESGSAWLDGQRGGGHIEAEQGLWPCGYHKLCASTMATCFWGGNLFTPKVHVKDKNNQDVPVQEFLQNAFLDMWDMVVKAVGDLEGVIGFQIMNEIHPGYINLPSLHSFDYNTNLHLSHIPSAFESFQLGAGHPTKIGTWTRSFPLPTRLTHYTLLNKNGVKAWTFDGPTQGRCIWEYHDVWRWSQRTNTPVILRENYFKRNPDTGREIDFYVDFYYPFALKWSERVRKLTSDKLVFLEAIPNEFCPPTWTKELRPPNMVFAPHWYDLRALFDRSFGDFTVNVQDISRGVFFLKTFYWGQKGARDNYTRQIRNIVEKGYQVLGENPVFIGECGIPMDMNNQESFKTEDFVWQARMMDAMITGLEKSLVGFALWNYNPENTDEKGDDWNGENFSWFSQRRALPPSPMKYDQDSPSLDKGGRILDAIVRPYPTKTAGIPVSFEYEMNTGTFTFAWADRTTNTDDRSGTPNISNPPRMLETPLTSRETEIFLPSRMTHGRKVVVRGLSKGDSWRYDERRQTLFIVIGEDSGEDLHRVVVGVDPPLKPLFLVNDFWTDFGDRVIAVGVGVFAIVAFWIYYRVL